MNGSLEFFSYRTHETGSYVDFHKHECFELVYYTTGKGTMNLNGELLRYSPHSVTLTRPNYMHDERHEEATEVIFFGFLYDDFPVHLTNAVILDTPEKEILALMLCMKEEILGQKQHYTTRVNLLLNEIILLIGRQSHAPASDNLPEKLFYARRFIDENYTQSIQLHTLAEISGYSNDHFRHLFKKQTGLSPLNYILNKRIDAAKRSLLNSTASVSEIGMDCGFSTTSQFIEMFKRICLKTPLQFRLKGSKD
ncbi:AraC family transcriptional regulator [Paenibacillus psychroresistens]|uniref:AraC family transcriptional regulator n=1 Tax=Paenibacillus psychroresistens TaxID=1778678 RepID=A0A6B8RP83_9BACL|nr:AraC family transcriptional regulator [Paenibacillus psychroresistens]QGQ98171.1 AraC family transcriptional regulator [Paenibacillus psychroresistens]